MIVGVDIDGVLANQIHGILPQIKERWGVDLTYEDVTHFRLPIADTDIAVEIVSAMKSPDYLLQMPVHEGARELLDWLAGRHQVKLITARPVGALAATRRWLEANGLRYDDLVSATEALKSRHGADILIDDYTANVSEFLQESDGYGILLSQPWNQNLGDLDHWLASERLYVAKDLLDVRDAIAHRTTPIRANREAA
jgi:5'(3')-deoxyribonucleotidase